MDVLWGFLSAISRDLVRGVVNQLRYPYCFNKFVDELEKEEGNLIATRNTVQDRVAHAQKQAKKSTEVVEKWLNDANNDVEKVNQLLTEARTKKTCCFDLCSNWIWRYQLGKKLAKKRNELKECTEKGRQHIQIERTATLPSSTLGFLSGNCLNFESRKSAHEQLMEALKDDQVGMIGLFGMGGCGKTTLAMEVGRVAEAEHLFDKVLFVPVSKTVEVPRIQEKIASSLQFEFPSPEIEEIERAQRLFHRLKQEKRILVILDDVWQRLNFRAIGIPSHEDHKGCKVFITTRSEDVCKLMDCERKVALQILSNEEAWMLFQKQANISEEASIPLELARDISDECKGLPVAIAAVAGSLKGKEEVSWKVALNRLRNSIPVNIEEGLQNPYKCLQLSYDYLDTEETKSLLMLCSAYPEDYEIPVEELTTYAIGLGLGGEVGSYDAKRNEVTAAKNKLISSCLLIAVEQWIGIVPRNHVKIHDLVRDVVQWIAKHGNKDVNEYTQPRYLWCEEFPNESDCSNLEFIRTQTNVEALDEILRRMRKLRVLILENVGSQKQLSMMLLKSMTNLRYLALEEWELSDISIAEDKWNLEGLALIRCSFPQLLNDVLDKELSYLKLLEIEDCGMEWSTLEVILRLPQLEELYVVDRRIKNKSVVCSENFDKFVVPQRLQRYDILFGRGYVVTSIPTHDRNLSVYEFHMSNEIIKGFARKAETLRLGSMMGCEKNIIPDIFGTERGSMNELKGLGVNRCTEIECLVENDKREILNVFSNLIHLQVGGMDQLRTLWHGRLPLSGSFEKLEWLHIEECPKLTSLFALNEFERQLPLPFNFFQNLKFVIIASCGELKYLFSICVEGDLSGLKESELDEIMEDEKPQVFPNPHFESNQYQNLRASTPIPSTSSFANHRGLFSLSKLTSLVLSVCPKLGSLFTSSITKTLISLESLELFRCDELKNLIEIDHDKKSWDAVFPKLKELTVDSCEHLEYMLGPYHQRIRILLPSLEILGLRNLSNFIKLNSSSQTLKELKDSYVNSENSFTFQNLKKVEIMKCERLEAIFPASCLRYNLPELEVLCIIECNELKQIIEEENTENQNLSNFLQPQPCFPKLKMLFIQNCNKLKRFISASKCDLPKLQFLIIGEASELEELIGEGDVIGNAKLELPKLNALIFWKLTKFRQEIESHVEVDRVVHDCPILSSTPTAILKELLSKIEDDVIRECDLSDEIGESLFRMLLDIEIEYFLYTSSSDEETTSGDTGIEDLGEATVDSSDDPKSRRASGSGSPSSQVSYAS
ncbi:probable disease resistance protein At1g61180 [Abrus precatorius]|uniref:Probable disease resistance protein At1g61180 n=1 Tax=Abrus precatorius TaxID=3816 RepID=A0A8B8MN09_ABRPR|nr:probable disease resistance protein At1g61180 [Abrus precatorius]